MKYRRVYSETAKNQTQHLHPERRTIVRQRLRMLSEAPYFGKRLVSELSGSYSLRARRFRILYKVREAQHRIEIHHIGHRKDIYELLSERLRSE